MKLIDNDDKEISEINMTPFVDIILVVLIIFMATATFMVEGKIPLNLPNSKTAQKKEIKEKKIQITIKKDGSLFLNGKPITKAQLKEELKNKDKDITVVLRSDKDTKFQNVVSVIDICKQSGLEKYMIETKKE
ncbi:ExbD/TolR family protein [Hydrogenothermus marinus]|uniref:Biopolymer transport protein ExbD n=1 Tax=Hydrogenothermus marinus TaxID=133270 RepID=A0A3M0B963_9AQUI|nr:biopolymer transporter ExbD [Hydrogenothermus marinus]RMA93106.1 biopolymer transport protein ExbD [Hydrogenothermus marinus]